MTRLLYFTRTQKERREGVSVWFGMEERESLYNSGEENINGMTFNEGWQMIKENHEARPYFSV